jgi:hypothetical protein
MLSCLGIFPQRNFSVAPLIQSRGTRIGLGSVAPSVGRMGIGIHGVGNCGSVASGAIPAVAAPTSESRNVQVLQVSIEDVPRLVRSVSSSVSLTLDKKVCFIFPM